MAATQILGLDEDDPHIAGEPCAQARAGDPAADDQDVAIA